MVAVPNLKHVHGVAQQSQHDKSNRIKQMIKMGEEKKLGDPILVDLQLCQMKCDLTWLLSYLTT